MVKKSLYSIFLEKLAIEDQLQQEGGEITDELDLIWQSKELELKDKIDNYGFTLTELDAEEAKIKTLASLTSTKVKDALTRIENLRSRLKARLYKVSGSKSLRGHIYNFHPFESIHRFIEHPEVLKPEEAYLTIEIREDLWNVMKDCLFHQNEVDNLKLWEKGEWKIKDRKGKVSELAEEHPAVREKRTPSVRIT